MQRETVESKVIDNMTSHIDLPTLFNIIEHKLFATRKAVRYDANGHMEIVPLKPGEAVNRALLNAEEREALYHADGFDVATKQDVLEMVSKSVDYVVARFGGATMPQQAFAPAPQTTRGGDQLVFSNSVLVGDELRFFWPGIVLAREDTVAGFHLCSSDAVTVDHKVCIVDAVTGAEQAVFTHTAKSASSTISRFVPLDKSHSERQMVYFALRGYPADVAASMQLVIKRV